MHRAMYLIVRGTHTHLPPLPPDAHAYHSHGTIDLVHDHGYPPPPPTPRNCDESSKPRQVTQYPRHRELLRGRAGCDAAWVVALALSFFSVASGGLEISLDLANVSGPVDMMDRPPPVWKDDSKLSWNVSEFNPLHTRTLVVRSLLCQ